MAEFVRNRASIATLSLSSAPFPLRPCKGVCYNGNMEFVEPALFPRDLVDFDRMFGTEEACRDYLMLQRWPDGFICPRCGGKKGWTNLRHQIECAHCHAQTSLTSGTAMEGTRKPLRTWFLAMWWVCTQKTGISAAGLKRILGLRSMQTAWTWLQKLRRAMVRVDREHLEFRVQVDEALVGGGGPVPEGKTSFKKAVIAVAVELKEDPHELGRIRVRNLTGEPDTALLTFIRENVARGTTLEIDGWSGFRALEKMGFPSNRIRETDSPETPLPHVQRVVALLKRWLLGTHQGRMGTKHFQSYLDEFVFRFNRRKSKDVGLLFQRMVKQSSETARVSFRQLVDSP